MAIVQNIGKHAVQLTSGQQLGPLETANVDPAAWNEAAMIAAGILLIVDGSVSPLPTLPSRSQFTSLEGAGHSWMFGDYATNNHGYLAKLGAMLGLIPVNRGIEGAKLGSDNQAPAGNGWVTVLQNLPRAAGGGPYLPSGSLHAVQFGLNDLGQFGGGPTAIAAFKASLRAVLSRIRAASTGVFEDSDASITYSGSWSSLANTAANSGTSERYTTTNGQTATIAVPADFPGGTIALGVTGQGNTSGVHTVTVDGTAAGSVDTRNIASVVAGKGSGNQVGTVLRLTGLAPGAHTIVDTVSAITSLALFDYWQIEAPDPPTILLLAQPRLTAGGYAAYTDGGAPFTPTDAMVQQLNVAIKQVASEFDSKVIVVDLDVLIGGNAGYFATGSHMNNAHPNDAGHSAIAAACFRAATGGWQPVLAAVA